MEEYSSDTYKRGNYSFNSIDEILKKVPKNRVIEFTASGIFSHLYSTPETRNLEKYPVICEDYFGKYTTDKIWNVLSLYPNTSLMNVFLKIASHVGFMAGVLEKELHDNFPVEYETLDWHLKNEKVGRKIWKNKTIIYPQDFS